MMTVDIKVAGRTFKMSASKCKITDHFPNDPQGMKGSRCNHTVRVNYKGKSTSFRFTNSIANFERGKRTLVKEDLKSALSSFLDDAIYGMMDYGDFLSELGYDEFDTRAKTIYRLCQKATNQTERLGIGSEELYELADTLREEGY